MKKGNIGKEYKPDAEYHETVTYSVTGSPLKLKSGGLACDKCGTELPPKELFCLECYRDEESAVNRKRSAYRAPKPDAPGNMFSGAGPLEQ